MRNKVLERESETEMKYLEVEGAPEQGGLRLRGGAVGHWAARRAKKTETDLRSVGSGARV